MGALHSHSVSSFQFDPSGIHSSLMSQRIASTPAANQRLLVIYGCGWLLGSWCWMLWQDGAVGAVGWMILNAMIGLMLVWPAWRLSQAAEPDDSPTRIVLMDWLYLQLLLQITLWPLRLTADWSLTHTACIALVLAIWPLATAGIVAWAWPREHRWMGMAACVGLVLIWPMAEAWGIWPSSLAGWSPLTLLWNLSQAVVEWG